MSSIERKSPREIEIMREAGWIVAEALEVAREMMRPGMTTGEINDAIHDYICSKDGYPTFLGQYGFPKSVCMSLNEQVVHGIPGARRLKEGDIVSIDIGCTRRKFIGDSAWTFPVGAVSEQTRRLLEVGERALWAGIAEVRSGARVVDISRAVQAATESAGYSVVRDYVGHGVGRKLHEAPQIPNYVKSGKGVWSARLRSGMTLAIEPMVNQGGSEVVKLKDDWTVVTKDRKLSVHFEHTVAVTDDGADLLTVLRDPGQDGLPGRTPSRRAPENG